MQMSKILIGISAAILLSTSTILSGAVYAQNSITINGAGATFPFPLIDTWRVDYQKVRPEVNINYQSIGSGGGIKQFTEKTVDFGGSDAPMTDEQIAAVQGDVLHIPTVLGAVVVTYQVPGVTRQIKLTPAVL